MTEAISNYDPRIRVGSDEAGDIPTDALKQALRAHCERPGFLAPAGADARASDLSPPQMILGLSGWETTMQTCRRHESLRSICWQGRARRTHPELAEFPASHGSPALAQAAIRPPHNAPTPAAVHSPAPAARESAHPLHTAPRHLADPRARDDAVAVLDMAADDRHRPVRVGRRDAGARRDHAFAAVPVAHPVAHAGDAISSTYGSPLAATTWPPRRVRDPIVASG